MWPIILTLLILGALLLIVEVFVPGLIVGIIGVLVLITATVLTYLNFGATAGNLLLLGEIVCGVFLTLWWLWYVPQSSFARRWSLKTSVTSPTRETDVLVGQVGQAVSALRPSGIAEIAGQRIDVITEGDLVASGDWVRIVKVEGNRIVVRRKEGNPELSA